MTEQQPNVPEPLAAWAGTWTGSGRGFYPTIEDFEYEEEITLVPTGRPFLLYTSRTWAPGRTRPMHTETGYLRVTDGGAVELLLTQPTGINELHRAEPTGDELDFAMVDLGRSPEAKTVHATRRRWRLIGDRLAYDFWMSHADTPMTHHLEAELDRG